MVKKKQRSDRRPRPITNTTARSMMALSHYKFKMLLNYKMDRVGGRVVECEEHYTSKTCSGCRWINPNLGGSDTFRCGGMCRAVLDRDVNAAKNILHKSIGDIYPDIVEKLRKVYEWASVQVNGGESIEHNT